jgi:autotransporter translocation and assembly factor TamB
MQGRRWWQWPLRGLTLLAALPIALVLALLWSPVVSRLVIIEALKRWDASNPAQLEWRELQGSLGAGLRVDALALIDGDGRPLLLVDRLELELGLSALLRGIVSVDRLALTGVDVWSDHQWGDLADPDAPVEPPKPGYGPDLPVEVRAAITIDDGRVWIDELERVEVGHVDVQARGYGREAAATLAAVALEMPSRELQVDMLALAAHWDSPRAFIERLQLESPLLNVEQLRASYDVSSKTGTLALDAHAPISAVAEQLGLELERLGEHARVSARARAGPRKLELALGLDLGPAGELQLHAAGVPTGPIGQRWAGARVRGRIGAGVLAAEARQGPMHFELLATVHERAQQSLVATVAGGIHDFRSGERLSLIAEATASSLDPLRGRATAEVHAAGLDLQATLERDTTALRGAVALRSGNLQRPLGLAAVLLGQPALAQLRGRIALDGRCHANAELLDSLVCRSELRLERASGFGITVGEARVHARVEPLVDPLALDVVLTAADLRGPGEALSFEQLFIEARGTLARLRLRVAGHGAHEQLQLAGAISLGERTDVELDDFVLHSDRTEAPLRVELRRPTRIGIASDAIDIDELSLAAAGGRIDVDGRLGIASNVASDVRLELADFELARIDPLLPGPSLGRLSIDAVAVYTDAGLHVRARAHGSLAAHISLVAFVPLRVAGGARLLADRPLAGHVVVKGLELLELGALMPDTPSWWRQQPLDAAAPPGDPKLIPEGLVDLELSLAGTPERPRVDATIRARRLLIDRTRLGSLFARGSFDERGVGLWLVAKPGFAEVDLRARVPATIDLARGTFAWMRDDDQHRISLDVRGLELERLRTTLGAKLPALEQVLEQAQLQGIVSLSLRGTGKLANPRLAAALRAGDLRHRGQALGRLRVLANYVPGAAELDLRLEGPLARRLHARARIPLWLPHDEQVLRVDVAREVFAEVHADELSLPALARYLGPLPIAGSLSGSLELTGELGDPQLDLHARVNELAMTREPLGNLLLRAGFEGGRVRVDAELFRAGAQIITAAAELPLLVELTPALRGSVLRWDRAGQHRVFARGRRIDEQLLAALLDSPLGTDGESNLEFELAGAGSPDAFRISGGLGGQLVADDQTALELQLGLELDERAQRADLRITPNRGEGLTGALQLAASIPALLAGEQQLAEIPFDVRVTAPDFDLRWLAGLLPQSVVDPRGVLHADLRGGGRLGAPRLLGSLELADAAITVVPLRQRLTNIDLELALAQDRIDVNRISLDAGRGGAKGSGRAKLDAKGELDARLELEFKAFPLIRPGLPAMIVDSGVQLELRRRGSDTDMTVVLRKPEVTVAGMNESTPQPIPTSTDVVVFGRGPASKLAEPERAAADHVTLRVELREPLLISGTSIDMAWAGALELHIDGGKVEVGGQVEARRGRLRLFGNSFELRRGIVTLPADGTLDPYIDLQAVSSLPEAEVTVTVRGRLSRPTLEFSSNPALSEYEILTLLITGSTEIGESDRDVAAKAASLLAAVSNPQLQNQLNQRLGLDRVAIGFGETIDQPILTIGKRIGRDVYVETRYHHNAPEDQNTTQIGVEYGFLPRWSLQGFFGDAAVGGLGFFWTRSFPAAAWASDLQLPDLQIEH